MTDIVERLWIDRDAKDPLLYGERKEAAMEIERLRKENERIYGILYPFACDCETHCEEFSYGCDSWLAQKAFDVKRENEK